MEGIVIVSNVNGLTKAILINKSKEIIETRVYNKSLENEDVQKNVMTIEDILIDMYDVAVENSLEITGVYYNLKPELDLDNALIANNVSDNIESNK